MFMVLRIQRSENQNPPLFSQLVEIDRFPVYHGPHEFVYIVLEGHRHESQPASFSHTPRKHSFVPCPQIIIFVWIDHDHPIQVGVVRQTEHQQIWQERVCGRQRVTNDDDLSGRFELLDSLLPDALNTLCLATLKPCRRYENRL